MGFLWDLVQQSQIRDQRSRSSTLEERVADLEQELNQTNWLLHQLLDRLEKQLGEDINRDGRIG